MKIGRIESVPLREIWKNEAQDFTRWLEKNIDILGEALDLPLNSAEREQPSGKFSVDLLSEDKNGNRVVIESQLEKTDHDHLGKTLTYLCWNEAKTAIWICSDPRPEHVKAIDWLNEISPADVSFYLVKAEGIRIGDSDPAPLFSIIAGPSRDIKDRGKKIVELAERHKKRLSFWEQLLERSKVKTSLHANITPGKYSSISTGAGKSGLNYNYVITYQQGTVELYIDRGKDSKEINKQIFDTLKSRKEKIESSFRGKLTWQRLDEKRGSRICVKFKGGLRDESKWPSLQDKMIDAMIRLENALRNHIEQLNI